MLCNGAARTERHLSWPFGVAEMNLGIGPDVLGSSAAGLSLGPDQEEVQYTRQRGQEVKKHQAI